jgi:hypothetical protein
VERYVERYECRCVGRYEGRYVDRYEERYACRYEGRYVGRYEEIKMFTDDQKKQLAAPEDADRFVKKTVSERPAKAKK